MLLTSVLLLLPAASALRVAAPRMQTQWSSPAYQPGAGGEPSSPSELCAALQSGTAPAGLADALSSTKGARVFFDVYLTDEEWTCADADAVPVALAEAMAFAPPPVYEGILMRIVAAAAKGSSPAATGERPRRLVNGLWDTLLPLRLSCVALQDTVATLAGEREEVVIDDAGGGDMELIRAQWSALLAFGNYDAAQLAAIRDELAKCRGSSGILAADGWPAAMEGDGM